MYFIWCLLISQIGASTEAKISTDDILEIGKNLLIRDLFETVSSNSFLHILFIDLIFSIRFIQLLTIDVCNVN